MYESWFRFRRRPFAAAPRVDDYYPAESSESARKSLIACVQRGAGPGLLIGSAGSGKSTLCHQLLSHFRTRTAVALVSCSGLATRRALFQNILFELGRPYRDLDEGELRLSLVDYLTSRDASHSGTVLLFDDAHHLNVELFEDLRMLSSMVRDGHWCVHAVLSGNVRLEEILSVPNLESLNQRIAARCYLEPFRGNETTAYVRRQFERVEGNAENVFIEGALTAIHECAGGTPRLINQLCDHALLLAATGSRSQLDEHGIREAWSDLQHLPPPERKSATSRSANEIVEFGSLDEDQTLTSVDTEAEINAAELVEEVGLDREPPHLRGRENPQASSTFRTATAETSENLPQPPEFAFNSEVQFSDDAESFELEAVDEDRCGMEPRGAAQVDADKSLDAIEAHLSRYDDERTPTTENPFFEDFAEEEVIVDRPSTLLNRVGICQTHVTSRHGQELQTVLDQFSLAAEEGRSQRSAGEIGSPRDLASFRDPVQEPANINGRTDGDAIAAAALADNVLAENTVPEHAGADSEAVAGAAAAAILENAVDFATSEVAGPEDSVAEITISEAVFSDVPAEEDDDVEEAPADDVIVADAIVEEAVVPQDAAIVVAAPNEVAPDTVIVEEAVFDDPVVAEASREVAVLADEDLDAAIADEVEHADSFANLLESADFEIEPDGGTSDTEPAHASPNDNSLLAARSAVEESGEWADVAASELGGAFPDTQLVEAGSALNDDFPGVDNADETSHAAIEMQAHGEPYRFDVIPPTAENGEVVEVFEVEPSELELDTLDNFVAQSDTKSLPRHEPRSSPGEVPTGEKMKSDREPLPRNAKSGRRLNRLFSNLADR